MKVGPTIFRPVAAVAWAERAAEDEAGVAARAEAWVTSQPEAPSPEASPPLLQQTRTASAVAARRTRASIPLEPRSEFVVVPW